MANQQRLLQPVVEPVVEPLLMVAEPVVLAPAQLPLSVELKEAVRQLERCQNEEEFTQIQQRIGELMNRAVIPDEFRIQDPMDRLQVIDSMRNTVQHLRENGQSRKAKRIEEVVRLLEKLPNLSPKKQRKALRKILRLAGKNVGVNVGATGLCGFSLCCNVACVAGTVVLVGGLVAVIVLAATGAFDPPKPTLEEVVDEIIPQSRRLNAHLREELGQFNDMFAQTGDARGQLTNGLPNDMMDQTSAARDALQTTASETFVRTQDLNTQSMSQIDSGMTQASETFVRNTQSMSQIDSGMTNLGQQTSSMFSTSEVTGRIGDGVTGDGPLSDADIFDAFFESLGQQPNVPNGHQTSAMFGNNPTGQMSATEAHILQLVEESGFELDEGATFIDPDNIGNGPQLFTQQSNV